MTEWKLEQPVWRQVNIIVRMPFMSHAAGCLSLVEVIWLVDDNACVTNADFGYASKSNRIKLIDFFRTRLLSTYNICN